MSSESWTRRVALRKEVSPLDYLKMKFYRTKALWHKGYAVFCFFPARYSWKSRSISSGSGAYHKPMVL